MPSINDILKRKAARLSRIPEELYTNIERIQRDIYQDLLGMLADLSRTAEGKIRPTVANFRLAEKINRSLSKILGSGDYLSAVASFAAEFDKQKDLADQYFQKAFPAFEASKIADQVFLQSKRNAVELLTGATPKTGFLQAINTEIDKAISSGASIKDTVATIRRIAIGGEGPAGAAPISGKLLQYAKQVASDAISVADRSYTFAIAEDLEAEWFLYAGDELPSSREFCIERHGNYYHKKEIEAWAALDWAGKMKDSTNEQTIFVNAGGWNCQHSIMPVTIDTVPREVIMRNIASGNFVPSEFERAELGL